MRKLARRLPLSQLWLVAVGIALGYFARLVLGPPAVDTLPQRAFSRPVVPPEMEFIDLPLTRRQ